MAEIGAACAWTAPLYSAPGLRAAVQTRALIASSRGANPTGVRSLTKLCRMAGKDELISIEPEPRMSGAIIHSGLVYTSGMVIPLLQDILQIRASLTSGRASELLKKSRWTSINLAVLSGLHHWAATFEAQDLVVIPFSYCQLDACPNQRNSDVGKESFNLEWIHL